MKAEMKIELAEQYGATLLKKAFCTPPFKVMDVTEDRKNGMVTLMLMSSSPGILDGDSYEMEINLGENCSLDLQTQAYQRIFNMKNGASQNMRICLEKNASFRFLPHPVVPHALSNFYTRTRINLSAGCLLVWGEVLTCGRKLNGEVFRFTRYQAVTEIFRSGRLVIKENLLLEAGMKDFQEIGLLEGHTHQASLIFLHDTAAVTTLVNQADSWLGLLPEIIYGITAAPVNGIIVRILGKKAEQLHDCIKGLSLQLESSLKEKGSVNSNPVLI